MKRHIPYLNFYPADFMNGVRGLSATEVGVYMMLLCRIYEESGPVEMHPLRLATYCGMRQATFESVLMKLVELGKLHIVGNTITNTRAEAEISKRADDLKNNSKAGKASAEKRQQKQSKPSTDVQQPFNHTDTDTDTDKSTEAIASDGDAVAEVSADPIKAVFDAGIRILTGAGITERQARPFIGKLRKDHPGQDGLILSAIMDCGRAGAVDPIPWITARLAKPKTPSVADIMAKIAAEERPQ